MATTLDQELARVDQQIEQLRANQEQANTTYMKESIQRQIDMLDTAGRAGVKRRFAERESIAAQQQQARNDAEQQIADRQIAAFKQQARRNYAGTTAEFERDFPAILQQWRINQASGLAPNKPRPIVSTLD